MFSYVTAAKRGFLFVFGGAVLAGYQRIRMRLKSAVALPVWRKKAKKGTGAACQNA